MFLHLYPKKRGVVVHKWHRSPKSVDLTVTTAAAGHAGWTPPHNPPHNPDQLSDSIRKFQIFYVFFYPNWTRRNSSEKTRKTKWISRSEFLKYHIRSVASAGLTPMLRYFSLQNLSRKRSSSVEHLCRSCRADMKKPLHKFIMFAKKTFFFYLNVRDWDALVGT